MVTQVRVVASERPSDPELVGAALPGVGRRQDQDEERDAGQQQRGRHLRRHAEQGQDR